MLTPALCRWLAHEVVVVFIVAKAKRVLNDQRVRDLSFYTANRVNNTHEYHLVLFHRLWALSNPNLRGTARPGI